MISRRPVLRGEFRRHRRIRSGAPLSMKRCLASEAPVFPAYAGTLDQSGIVNCAAALQLAVRPLGESWRRLTAESERRRGPEKSDAVCLVLGSVATAGLAREWF